MTVTSMTVTIMTMRMSVCVSDTMTVITVTSMTMTVVIVAAPMRMPTTNAEKTHTASHDTHTEHKCNRNKPIPWIVPKRRWKKLPTHVHLEDTPEEICNDDEWCDAVSNRE